jgi:hypothetical protein
LKRFEFFGRGWKNVVLMGQWQEIFWSNVFWGAWLFFGSIWEI